MYYICYNCGGEAISDFSIEDRIDTLIRSHRHNQEVIRSVSNSLFIHAFRARIAKGEIDHKDVTFIHGYYDGTSLYGIALHPDKTGRIDKWPDGFCDRFDKYMEILIDLIP